MELSEDVIPAPQPEGRRFRFTLPDDEPAQPEPIAPEPQRIAFASAPVAHDPAPIAPEPAPIAPEPQPIAPAPVTSEPVTLEPPAFKPAELEPVVLPPVLLEPVAVEPVAVEPVAVEPVLLEPVLLEPVALEPVLLEPVLVEPAGPEPVADDQPDWVTSVDHNSAEPTAEAEPTDIAPTVEIEQAEVEADVWAWPTEDDRTENEDDRTENRTENEDENQARDTTEAPTDEDDVWNWPGGDDADRRSAERRSAERRAGGASEDQPRPAGKTPRLPTVEKSDDDFDGDPWADLRGMYAEPGDIEALANSRAAASQRKVDAQELTDAADREAQALELRQQQQAAAEIESTETDESSTDEWSSDESNRDEPNANESISMLPTPWAASASIPEPTNTQPVAEPLDEPDAGAGAWDDWSMFDDPSDNAVDSTGWTAATPATNNSTSIDSWDNLPAADEFDWDSFDAAPTNAAGPTPSEIAPPTTRETTGTAEVEWTEGEPEWADSAQDDDADADEDDGWVLDEHGEWIEAPAVKSPAAKSSNIVPVGLTNLDWSGRGEEADAFGEHHPETDESEPAPWWLEGTNIGGTGTALGAESGIESQIPVYSQVSDLYDDDDEDDDDYGQVAANNRGADLFYDDADLDAPDEFELDEDEWALVDEDPRSGAPRKQSREPASRKKDSRKSSGANKPKERNAKAAPKRNPAGRGGSRSGASDKQGSQLTGLLHGSKVVPIIVGIAAIVVLAVLFKTAFARVAAAPNPASTQVATCATETASANIKNVGTLESSIMPLPAGWQVAPDYQADTGAIDFSKALKDEPNPATALASLDQTRFDNGFSRAFTQGAIITTVAIYQFNAASCAADYVHLHSTDPVKQTFDASSVAAVATGQVVTSGVATDYVVRAAKANQVEVLTWAGDKAPAHAVSGVLTMAAGQWTALPASR